jgi:hypothetical protein
VIIVHRFTLKSKPINQAGTIEPTGMEQMEGVLPSPAWFVKIAAGFKGNRLNFEKLLKNVIKIIIKKSLVFIIK